MGVNRQLPLVYANLDDSVPQQDGFIPAEAAAQPD